MAGSILMIIRSFSACFEQDKGTNRVVFLLKMESTVTLVFWCIVFLAVFIFKISY